MSRKRKLSAALEDYVEAIYHLQCNNKVARSKDISSTLNVHKSTVTNALKSLSEKGLINYEPYGLITLTQTGEKLARDVVRRHNGLKDFFVKVLGVDAELAESAACRMEHSVPRQIADRFVEFVNYFEREALPEAEKIRDFLNKKV